MTTARELTTPDATCIGADDDAAESMRTMAEHEVRRLPVIDGHTLVGFVARADVARSLPDPRSANSSKHSPADTQARAAGREFGTPSVFVTEEA
ncbi:CBS domain-containing protein [Streptomyces sp. SFB5A]|uniref:CBS domain-containing protein n=1 Tax=Streptomyces nymphaeiformis TaxID=2663842 RepID=A0A7W7XAZ5_9ACTN|nr:CBS domain-containing protein [Streptomyces nymphaeiformis]MBB4980881.1 CBS domain-containing protein [Streptomyces nymphaeiformis]